MKNMYKHIDNAASAFLGMLLVVMGIFMFGNVVLRYFFNSGWTWAEEVSRFIFVWISFIGALLAVKDNNHLGFTSLIQRMPHGLKKLLYVFSNVIMIYVLYLFLDGSWKMTQVGMLQKAPTTGLSLGWLFGVGVIVSIGMAIIILYNTYRAIFVSGAIDALVTLKDSEEEINH